MKKDAYPYLDHFKPRGKERIYYFRVGHGKRVRLPGPYNSPQFREAYRAALASHKSGELTDGRTVKWLIEQYQASPAWEGLAKETKKQFKYQLVRLKARIGKAPITDITSESITKGRDERAAKPTDANKFLKCTSALFRFAIERKWLTENPVKGVERLDTPSVGFHTWTEEEAFAFEQRWPVGTRERLAFDLLVYTGVRRSDVVRLGRQHTKAGEITITTEKSRNMGKPVEVTITILPPLARSIEAAKTGHMNYLVTHKKKAFGKESFGNWFRKACKAAGVPGSSHGLRKLAAVRMAENGATEAELNAVFGWADGSSESRTYVRKANRKRLAKAGIVKVLSQHNSQTASETQQNKGKNK